MPGIIFLFLAWGAWITATFILDKKKTFRFPIAMVALILIILHSTSITIYSIQIGAASLPLIFSAYWLVYQGTWLKKIYLFCSVMIIMLGYVGFYLLELYDPVWVLVDRKILLTVGLLVLGWMLYPTSFIYRCAAIVIGSLQAEVFLSIFFLKWRMPYPIGSNDYLDIMALTVLTLLTAHAAEKLLLGLKKAVTDGLKEKKQMVH